MGVQERKERDFRAREQALKAAALDLFAADDWESVTVEAIAQRAEYAKGTIYKHFASKDDLYARLAIDYAEQSYRELLAVPQDLSFEKKLAAYVDVYWDRFEAEPPLRRISLYVQRDDFLARVPETTRKLMAATDAKHLGLVRDLIDQAANAGLIPPGDINNRIAAMNATLMGALRLASMTGGYADPTSLRRVTVSALLALLESDRL